MLISAGESMPRGSELFEPFSFVQIGDPQMGFGYDGLEMDIKRFRFLSEDIKNHKPAFALVMGDFTQGNKPEEIKGYTGTKLPVSSSSVAGNHEIGNPSKPDILKNYAKELKKCRKMYGEDNFSFTYNNCEFIGLNSQTFCGDTSKAEGETLAELTSAWKWFEETLEKANNEKRDHIFVFMHIPPFVKSEMEKGFVL